MTIWWFYLAKISICVGWNIVVMGFLVTITISLSMVIWWRFIPGCRQWAAQSGCWCTPCPSPWSPSRSTSPSSLRWSWTSTTGPRWWMRRRADENQHLSSGRCTMLLFRCTILYFSGTHFHLQVHYSILSGTPFQVQVHYFILFRYTLSLLWHPTLTTGVLPLLGLAYMNMNIFVSIRCATKFSNGKNL